MVCLAEKKCKKGIIAGTVAAGVAVATAVDAIRAYKYTPEKKESVELEDEYVDLDKYIDDLSDAITFKTISNRDPEQVDWQEFERYHAFLRERFPNIFTKLRVEDVSYASLMIYWEGSDPSLDPICLLGHQDVVPVTDGTLDDWKYPPFGKNVAEGYIWGRGALDMKNHVIGVLEAVELLLKEGWQPVRGIYICLGHDEEIVAAKDSGASAMAALFKERGVHLDSIIDEGGAIIPATVKGVIDTNLVGIGIAEKGYADFEISINAKGGHSSQPPVHSAVGQLADVIKDIEGNQFKAEITPLVSELLDRICRRTTYPVRLVTVNLPLLKPAILQVMKQIPMTATFVRTTTAVTQASGSPQANVLPQKASVVVNFRIMPGQTIADVEKHLHKVIKNKDVEIKFLGGKEPSKVSPIDSKAFKTIEDIYNSMDDKNLVAPYLVMGGTDSYRYEGVCENIYRFSPYYVSTDLLLTIHGTNERIPTDIMADAVVFFKRYIKQLSKE